MTKSKASSGSTSRPGRACFFIMLGGLLFGLVERVVFGLGSELMESFKVDQVDCANHTSSASQLMPAVSTKDSFGDKDSGTGMFDKAYRWAYDRASAEETTTRTKFNLTEWEPFKTTGGLQDADRILLADVYYNASSVFEFGLGESTKIAAKTGVPRYSGVDSDPVYVATAREGAPSHYRFFFADIGKTVMWGHPVEPNLRKNTLQYQLGALEMEKEAFDVYLVDGRYRVACVMASFLHAMRCGGDMSVVRVGMHDIGDTRRGYDETLKVAEIEASTEFLRILQLKPNVTEADIYALWEKHATNTARRN